MDNLPLSCRAKHVCQQTHFSCTHLMIDCLIGCPGKQHMFQLLKSVLEKYYHLNPIQFFSGRLGVQSSEM